MTINRQNLLETGWCKLEAGRYARYHRGLRFEVEYDPESGEWLGHFLTPDDSKKRRYTS